MPRNTQHGGQERPAFEAPGGAPVPPSTDAERAAQDEQQLFEVMVDTWGYGGDQPQFVRGDLVTPADAPQFDFGWAERIGTIRAAPEYMNKGIVSTTKPQSMPAEPKQKAERE